VAATLKIRELPKGLSLRVTEPKHLGRILLSVAVAVTAALFFFHKSSSMPLDVFVGGVFVFAIVRYLISEFRGTDVELVVTNLDFKTTGHAPDGYRQGTISRADIYNLEYRKSSGGGEDNPLPSGLYIESSDSVWHSGSCVLPSLDEAQTQQAIDAILNRFPDTCTLPSAREPYLTTLNLSNRK
jgi:hypothetical protein